MKCWVGGWQFSFFLTSILLGEYLGIAKVNTSMQHAAMQPAELLHAKNVANVRYVEIWLLYYFPLKPTGNNKITSAYRKDLPNYYCHDPVVIPHR